MMQTDVKSTHLNTTGTITANRSRLKGFSVAPGVSAGLTTISFRNGSTTGTILCQLDLPTNSNPNSFYVLVPGEGILFESGIYFSLDAGSSLGGVTAFYG
jgi:hypothetical protein